MLQELQHPGKTRARGLGNSGTSPQPCPSGSFRAVSAEAVARPAARGSALAAVAVQAASLRLAFWTVGAAAFAFASGRAFTVTAAGLAAIVISSPVAGLRPGRAFV